MKERLSSAALFEKAKNFIPGGVNSPVRAFKAVGGNPVFMKYAKGPYLYDQDDNRYVDLINSWGPMILGHAHPEVEEAVKEALVHSPSFGAPTAREVEMAELVCELVPSIEKVRMVNSGTEATMAAVRVARGFTGRDKIIKFEGCYHGHGDSFLIAAGSGALTFGTPDSPGVTIGTAKDTLVATFNDLASVEHIVDQNCEEVAAIILEPVVGNMGCVPPLPGFLEGLRTLCDKQGIVLIFDEVMTGFRLSLSGAQGLYNVKPDLTTLGKIIGGGLPVGAYGGKKEIMDKVSPNGPIYQAGTLSGNPLAMAAGLAMLRYLKMNPALYDQLERNTDSLSSGIHNSLRKQGFEVTLNRVGSMFTLFFAPGRIIDFKGAVASDTSLFGRYFRAMLDNGVYLAPSQFEAMFVSEAISEAVVDEVLSANEKAIKGM